MNKYEVIYTISLKLSEEERQNLNETILNTIKNNDGEIIESVEFGIHKFPLSMYKKIEGDFRITSFNAPAGKIESIGQKLKYDERILRYIIIKRS